MAKNHIEMYKRMILVPHWSTIDKKSSHYFKYNDLFTSNMATCPYHFPIFIIYNLALALGSK